MSSFAPPLRLVLTLGMVSLIASCGGEPPAPSEAEIGAAEQEISGGYIDQDDPNVVGIYWAKFGGICTGSLLAPNMVLTARHCVSEINSANGSVDCGTTTFSAPGSPNEFYVTTLADMPMDPNGYMSVKEVITLPVDNKICGKDQAILILSENVDAAVAKPLVPRVDAPVKPGEHYSAVGFGLTSDFANDAGKRRRRDDLKVVCVAEACPAQFVKPEEWTGNAGVCQGDSGGPALDLQGRVIGVTSRGGQNCSSPVYGYVEAWGDWIKETALHAAEVGGYTAPAWVTGWPTDPELNYIPGDACLMPTDCPSNRCVTNGTDQYCTRLCTDAAPCPDGFLCQPDENGENVCTLPPPPPPDPVETANDSGSCRVSVDPTKPVPWRAGVFGLALVALGLRRRKA